MRAYPYGALLALAVVAAASAADAPIEGARVVAAPGYAELKVKAPQPGDTYSWVVFPLPPQKTDRGDGWLQFAGDPGKTYSVFVTVVNFDKKRHDAGQYEVAFEGKEPEPIPPPKPKPDPKPSPASFRVILVFESGDNLTPAQRGVVYGKAVEDWLSANCTGGKAGWRRRDKDAPGDADPTMAALWAAVQPKVTATPCVAVERDGKVDIVNTEATPAAMIGVFEKYKAGK